ncbi:MAG: DUF554 domain-containing protein [Clostridiales bacterium]|nr:DUF554 domain-containing protein [Clostridiales bacterium]
MPGMGTLINVGAIIAGGLAGTLFGKRIEERYREIVLMAIGIASVFLGIAGAMEKMLQVEDGKLVSGGSMMMIISLVLGSLIGEYLNIELHMEEFGEWLKRRSGNEGDVGFIHAFVTASLTVCIGAMAIVGSVRDGIYGDYSILAAKAVMDMLIIMAMTASMGKGCIFAAVPVGMFQGAVTLVARLIEPLLTESALDNLSLVGSVLIFCVGVNLIRGKMFKVANMLPSIVVAAAWAFLPR